MTNRTQLLPILLGPAVILLVPASAMLFRAEGWAWSLGDFVAAWVLLAGVGLTYKLVARPARDPAYRLATALGLAGGLALVWINGAVGLIGSEDNPANLLYGAVLAVGGLGALAVRFRARGMARVLFVTGAVQLLVPVIAIVIRPDDFGPGPVRIFILNTMFALLFAGAGLLYRRAATSSGES